MKKSNPPPMKYAQRYLAALFVTGLLVTAAFAADAKDSKASSNADGCCGGDCANCTASMSAQCKSKDGKQANAQTTKPADNKADQKDQKVAKN
jgi:hypothetical protein